MFGVHTIRTPDAGRLRHLHGVRELAGGRRGAVRVFGKCASDAEGRAVFVIPCGCVYRYEASEGRLAVRMACRAAQTPVRELSALERAQRLLGDPSAVFLDTETTGTDEWAEVIEVAVVDVRGGTLVDTLVRPRFPVPAEVTRLTGIGEGDVIPAPAFDAVYPAVVRALEGRRAVGWHIGFDREVIGRECRRRGLAEPGVREWVDAADVVQAYFHLPEPPSLEAACALLRVIPEARHRAAADARLALAVLRALAGA